MLKKLTALAIMASAAAVPATAQTQNGLVNVNIGGDVLSGILNNNEIDILRNANFLNNNVLQVAVPVNVAAAVCGTQVPILGNANQRASECTATSTSPRLTQIVRRQLARAQRAN